MCERIFAGYRSDSERSGCGDSGGECGRLLGDGSDGSSCEWSGDGGSRASGVFGRLGAAEFWRVVYGELLSSVHSSSCASSPTWKLAVPFTGASFVPFFRRLAFVCAFSDFDLFPNLLVDPLRGSEISEWFFLNDTFDPVLGRLVCELLRLKSMVEGLVDGLSEADRAWPLVWPAASVTAPWPSFESL